MRLIKTYTLEIKKSKFIGYYYEITSDIEAKEIIKNIKKEHKKARHIPYAYVLFNSASKSDDKEPSNTAGLPIYNVLLNKNVNNRLICIVRYFGGTKLGANNLMRTYSKVASLVSSDE